MTSLSSPLFTSLAEAERKTALDNLLIRSIEKLDSIIELRNDLNQYMETGMIDLARARYATGGLRSTISSLSFNLGRMEATKRVSLEPVPRLDHYLLKVSGDDVTRFHLQAAISEYDKLSRTVSRTNDKNHSLIVNDQPEQNDRQHCCSDNSETDMKNNENPQVRQRQVGPFQGRVGSVERDSLECSDSDAAARSSLETTTSNTTDIDQLNANTAGGSSISGYSSDNRESTGSSTTANRATTNHVNDPLRWFGVLVPSSLRTSKQCFDRALEILAEVATQQNELAHLLDMFQHLQKLEGGDNNLNVAKLTAV
ncbi:coiled-coil domain-containing protein-like [Tropilaelaps mercedesae]|uniref:Vacuolar ATPase assembly protein VMA22 n=1 Tax=Tropilaelaps mercedesae TaxID=418985 RepID=A0A1V9Y0M7_9ACAR|nr:coiled-coil domain-containing protein-like [Tropilaelaps mercedesae]